MRLCTHLAVLCAVTLTQLVSGCASSNPLAAATDLSQRAYALYGTFVIVEQEAAKVFEDPSVPASIKDSIRNTDAKAKPAADALLRSALDYRAAYAALQAHTGTQQSLTFATQQLSTWLSQAQNDVSALVTAVHTVPGH